jgi:hypothetical protein
MATRQCPFALDVTAALDEFEVFRHFTPYLASVIATLERELVTHASLLTCHYLGFLVLEHDINYRGPRAALAG